jgi:RHS repeat-associated protein
MCKVAGASTQPCSATGNTQFVWNTVGGLPLLLKDGSTAYVYGPGSLPLEQIAGSTTYYFHHDQLGSTRLITDSTGAAKATYTYDPYGNLHASTGSIVNPFRFGGQYLDTESSLLFLRGRYYDPATGQFITRDPLSSMTREPYGYASDDPTNRTDPTGLYDYKFTETIGPVGGGSQAVMAYLQQHLGQAFPFPTGNCSTVISGAECHLQPAPFLPGWAYPGSQDSPVTIFSVTSKLFQLQVGYRARRRLRWDDHILHVRGARSRVPNYLNSPQRLVTWLQHRWTGGSQNANLFAIVKLPCRLADR